MTDENALINPYAPSGVQHNTLHTLDDIITYAKKKQGKSFFCCFLVELADQHPQAVANFLGRFARKDETGTHYFFPDVLQYYNVKNPDGTHTPISEKEAFKEASKKFEHNMERRAFIAIGAAMVGSKILGDIGNTTRENNQRPKSRTATQQVVEVASMTVGLSVGSLLASVGTISAFDSLAAKKQLGRLSNEHCSMSDFDEFILQCDDYLMTGWKQNVSYRHQNDGHRIC